MTNTFNVEQIERLSPQREGQGDAIMNGDETRNSSLDDCKTFRTDVRCDNEHYNDVPTVVEFTIDGAIAAQIMRLAALVKANHLHKVEKFDYRARYLKYDPQQDPENARLAGEENEFRTEADLLNVTDQEFWFSAYIRHTDIKTSGEPQRVDDLIQHFALERPPASD